MDKFSSCCGVEMNNSYQDMLICPECKEHCSVEFSEEDETDKLEQSIDLDINRELNPAN